MPQRFFQGSQGSGQGWVGEEGGKPHDTKGVKGASSSRLLREGVGRDRTEGGGGAVEVSSMRQKGCRGHLAAGGQGDIQFQGSKGGPRGVGSTSKQHEARGVQGGHPAAGLRGVYTHSNPHLEVLQAAGLLRGICSLGVCIPRCTGPPGAHPPLSHGWRRLSTHETRVRRRICASRHEGAVCPGHPSLGRERRGGGYPSWRS